MMLCFIVGVSHLTVPDDLAGAMAILDWLAFVPKVSVIKYHRINTNKLQLGVIAGSQADKCIEIFCSV